MARLFIGFMCSAGTSTVGAEIDARDVQFSQFAATEILPYNAFAGSSINLSVFRSSGIIESGGSIWISYFDAEENVVVGHRESPSPVWHWRKLDSSMESRMLGDGHQSINMGLSDGVIHLCWGAHGTHPVYRALSAKSLQLLDLTSPFSPAELASYPQFVSEGTELLLFSRRDHTGEITVRRWDAPSHGWMQPISIINKPREAESIYIHTPASRPGLLAVGFTVRWPDPQGTIPPRVINLDIHTVYSTNAGLSWLQSDDSIARDISPQFSDPVLHMGPERTLLNQGGTTLDDTGRLWLACTNATPSGVWQVSLVAWSRGSQSAEEITVRATTHRADLRGRGTLKLPVSRALVFICEERLYVIYRDDPTIFISTAKIATPLSEVTWQHHEIARGDLGAWEPVASLNDCPSKPVMRFLFQSSVQAANDLPEASALASEMRIAAVELFKLE